MDTDADDPAVAARPVPQIIALGASAGGLDAFTRLLGALPEDLPVPVVMVQHLDPRHTSHLTEILARHTALRVTAAEEGARLEPGTVTVGVPDRHLLVLPGRVSLGTTPPVRFARPSIDVLFESVASAYGDRAVAVVLTGSGRDGAIGVEAVKGAGSVVVVQDEATAAFAPMPHAAIATGAADLVLPLDEIAPALVDLVAPGREPS